MRASGKYAARPQLLRSHPILKRLLTLKQAIQTLENINVGQDVSDEDEEDDEDEDHGFDLKGDSGETLWDRIIKRGLESDELAELIKDADECSPPSSPRTKSSKNKSKSSGAEDDFDPAILPALSSSTVKPPPKKKRKTAMDAPTGPVFDLVEPDFTSTSSKKTKTNSKTPAATVDAFANVADSYGEATALSYADMNDKQARKKSLRFHVSRIESSSSRRQNARTNALGGDVDIPYRERKKERDVRLQKERQQQEQGKKLGMGGDDLDDIDPEFDSHNMASDASHKSKKRRRPLEDGDDDNAMGYYDLVKTAVASKKAKKKTDYEAVTAASRYGEF